MSKFMLIPEDHESRVDFIINEAWKIFVSSFHFGKHQITKEAPFQLHFANIIQNVGQSYSIKPNEIFKIDLETREENIRNKLKYIDITCGYLESYKVALELKFKTTQQGAQNHSRIDCYQDIETLEILKSEGKYHSGYFFMITDSATYINKSKKGVGTIFAMHDGHRSSPNNVLTSKGKKGIDVTVKLLNSYLFNWFEINGWYFLKIKI